MSPGVQWIIPVLQAFPHRRLLEAAVVGYLVACHPWRGNCKRDVTSTCFWHFSKVSLKNSIDVPESDVMHVRTASHVSRQVLFRWNPHRIRNSMPSG